MQNENLIPMFIQVQTASIESGSKITITRSKAVKHKLQLINDENQNPQFQNLKRFNSSILLENDANNKRIPLKSIQNKTFNNKLIKPQKSPQLKCFTPKFSNVPFETINLDDSITLNLTCTSDPIYDIILNNSKSTQDVYLPPFARIFNLECSSDPEKQLPDNIEDILSFRREKLPDLVVNQPEAIENPVEEVDKIEVELDKKRKLQLDVQSNDSFDESNKKVKIELIEENVIEYVFKKVNEIFTKNEIKNCIFLDKKNLNRSKIRVPFDADKTYILKMAISDEFSLSSNELDELWYSIRPKINRKLGKKK